MARTTMSTLVNPEDRSLKPRSWDEMIGQDKLKSKLQLISNHAAINNERLEPTLLIGPPGTGKSSLAALVAQEAGLDFLDIMITPDFKMSTINRVLMEHEGLLFLDEIQNMPTRNQYYIYNVLQENEIRLDNGKCIAIENQISIVAATTDPQKLNDALVTRFDKLRFADYSEEELARIVAILATRLKLSYTKGQCEALGRASAGSPRQARQLVKMANRLGSMDTEQILDMCEITEDGLTEDHMAYLESLYKLGGTAGVENLSNHSLRSKDEILKIEKLLVKRQFVEIAKKGRTLMMPGLKALKNEGRV